MAQWLGACIAFAEGLSSVSSTISGRCPVTCNSGYRSPNLLFWSVHLHVCDIYTDTQTLINKSKKEILKKKNPFLKGNKSFKMVLLICINYIH